MWSEAEDKKLLRMWCADEPPRTVREIADELERSKSSVDRRIAALDLRGHKGDRAKYEQETGVSLEPIIRPVRVEGVKVPKGSVSKTAYTVLVWGDVHYPFHDPAAVNVLYQITRDVKPDKLVCIGDVFDFFELSDHRPPRDDDPDLQGTLNQGTGHLATMLELAEPDEAFFLGGNHEDRWDRMLLKARRDVRFRQLLKLPKIRRALDFAEVVGFDELGYEYRPYTEGQALVEHDKLVLTHGDRANKYVSRSMLDKYGKNIIFGHKHVIQSWTRRDLKGQEAGWCIGCLCTLEPHYDHFADWHHGFVVVDWAKVDGEWLFDVTQVRIHDGTAIYKGKVYNG